MTSMTSFRCLFQLGIKGTSNICKTVNGVWFYKKWDIEVAVQSFLQLAR